MELKYLEKIETLLKQNLTDILERLKSRFPIYHDWFPQFRATARKGYIATDLDKGAEKVLGFFLSKLNWQPIAVPIASDFMYKTDDAFIHIETKTALITNPSDYKGVIDIAENQTSFNPNLSEFQPRLPQYYLKNTPQEKACLTYVILIVHIDAYTTISKGLNQNPIAILLISLPNGQLQQYYVNRVVRKGKQKKGHFRYKYSTDTIFRVIQNQTGQSISRIKIIYTNPDYLEGKVESVKDFLSQISKFLIEF